MTETSRIYIRKTNDLDLVFDLDNKVFDAPGEEDIDFRGKWWIVWQNKDPVGYAGIRTLVTDPDLAFMHRVGVIPAARGQGIHRRLIQVRLDWAKKQGLAGVITYTVFDNLASSNNLIKEGFKLYRPEVAWAGDALYWEYVF